jgi:preprotein translocase subunit Sec63
LDADKHNLSAADIVVLSSTAQRLIHLLVEFRGKMGEFYKLLNISRSATINEIKASYRKLAMELHPDRNGSDPLKTARFRTISAAYEILSDEKKRVDYDRTLGNSGYGKCEQRGRAWQHPYCLSLCPS